MKRTRNFVQCCNCCNIQFESSVSYKRHCSTKSHKHKLLRSQNAMIMAGDEPVIEDRMIVSSSDPPYAPPDFFEKFNLDANHELVSDEEMEVGEFSDDASQTLEAEDEGQTLPAEEMVHGNANNFFPFPDEKFFLLYCHAHGIMRPKVLFN